MPRPAPLVKPKELKTFTVWVRCSVMKVGHITGVESIAEAEAMAKAGDWHHDYDEAIESRDCVMVKVTEDK